MKTMLFNPYSGKPRHPSDIASDPAGILMLDPDEPVLAYKPAADRAERAAPVDMMLYCPNCGRQHVDAPEQGALISGGPNAGRVRAGWSNPPHRSHLCHSCGTIWRPADVPTNGVASITTTGKADTWVGKSPFAAPAIPSSGAEGLKP